MTQHFAVPVGKVKLVLYDGREGSQTYGKVEVLQIGEGNYCMVKVPTMIWYGFQGISEGFSLIANCADIPHDPQEIERTDPSDKKIPYDWSKGNE